MIIVDKIFVCYTLKDADEKSMRDSWIVYGFHPEERSSIWSERMFHV